MTDISLIDTSVVNQPVIAEQPPVEDGTAVVPDSVHDFVAAFDFVKAGIEQLGVEAEEELKLLARKYL
ncbi:hypothetical protein ACSFCT_09310 [Yokenella regensburgei]|uniref:hypothetical protein n=1 Tax=Yokenella regensburgei TaxID=158877 RepID=UPI003EDA3546